MRTIEADALIDEMSFVYDIVKSDDDPYNIGVMAAIATVKRMPTIDAVSVVRCKDCKWHTISSKICRKYFVPRQDNDYCSRAEREKYETY